MDSKTASTCPWLERTSALLDGELPTTEHEMVRTHSQTCGSCAALLQPDRMGAITRPGAPFSPSPKLTFPRRDTPQIRALLAIVGTLILLGSMPGFIRGNTSGNSFHELRHLSMWQVSIGVGVLSAAISYRISRLLMAMIATFLALSLAATIYDLSTGHRGPWTDPLHIVEIAAVLAMTRLVLPQLRLRKTRGLERTPGQ